MTTARALAEQILGQSLARAVDMQRDAPSPMPYPDLVIAEALSDLGVRESGGPNRGERVDKIVRAVGLDPEDQLPWCAAAIYAWHLEAAQALGHNYQTTCPRTAGAIRQWHGAALAGCGWSAQLSFIPIRPGDVFYRVRRMSTEAAAREVERCRRGHSRPGHTGLIVAVHGDVLETIEGNTNEAGSREGDGVYAKTIARHDRHLVGFARYGAVRAA